MCGRFALKNPRAIKAAFQLKEEPDLRPRYNIAPTQNVAIIRANAEDRYLSFARWGLIPSWSKTAASGFSTINARAESVDTKATYRMPFKRQRCIIPADGFYEWHQENGMKIPNHICMQDDQPFALAGLWDVWKGPEGEITSCTIIVTSANQFMQKLHDRMPVILEPKDYDRWLDSSYQDVTNLKGLLEPSPEEWLKARPVNRILNNPRNDTAECVALYVS